MNRIVIYDETTASPCALCGNDTLRRVVVQAGSIRSYVVCGDHQMTEAEAYELGIKLAASGAK